jgi:hypothetical protein
MSTNVCILFVWNMCHVFIHTSMGAVSIFEVVSVHLFLTDKMQQEQKLCWNCMFYPLFLFQ